MDYNKKVGQRIQEYREKAKMSQETLGEYVGLSSTSISNIERGLHYPSMDNFIKIANSLGVSADLLLSDVVDSACITKESELSRKLSNLPSKKKTEIFAVIETMIKNN